MADTSIRFAALAAMFFATTFVRASDAEPVRYDLVFHMQGAALDTVEVRATTHVGSDGAIEFAVPTWEATGVHAEEGSLDTSTPGRWRLSGQPGSEVVLSWRTQPASPSRNFRWDTWQSVLVRPDAVVASTGVLFAIPQGSDSRAVEVRWSAPPGWVVSTSLAQETQTVAQLRGGTFLAARSARTAKRRAGAATITIAALANARDVERIADVVARAVAEATPLHARHDYTFNIVDFDDTSPGRAVTTASTGGTAYLTGRVPDGEWLPWVVVAAASPEPTEGEPTTAWYDEGFANYRIVSDLFSKGYLPPAAFARIVDQATTSYGNSPFRRAPQAQVEETFASSRDKRELPANRGLLFAVFLDARIRAATGGTKTLADALAHMNTTGDPGPALVDAVARIGAGDVGPLYRRYIVDGDLLQLPRDALGPCFTIGTVADWSGWQVQHVFAKPWCPPGSAARP